MSKLTREVHHAISESDAESVHETWRREINPYTGPQHGWLQLTLTDAEIASLDNGAAIVAEIDNGRYGLVIRIRPGKE